jgi:hypothetical protein
MLDGAEPFVRVRQRTRWQKGRDRSSARSSRGTRVGTSHPGRRRGPSAQACRRAPGRCSGIPRPGGRPYDPHHLTLRVLGPACEEAGVEWAGFHTFRHTIATRMFAAGRNAVQVQHWLGHHSAAFTLATHVHLLDGDSAALSSRGCEQGANRPSGNSRKRRRVSGRRTARIAGQTSSGDKQPQTASRVRIPGSGIGRTLANTPNMAGGPVQSRTNPAGAAQGRAVARLDTGRCRGRLGPWGDRYSGANRVRQCGWRWLPTGGGRRVTYGRRQQYRRLSHAGRRSCASSEYVACSASRAMFWWSRSIV